MDGGPGQSVADAADLLYALDPDQFTTTRDRLARRARDAGDTVAATAIARLRRPSIAAWAVNLVVRDVPDLLTRLTDLGSRLRSAQADVDAARIQSLRPERDGLVEDFVTEAVDLAAGRGHALSGAGRDEVRACLIAAIASEDACGAVATGRLTRTLSYSGFGEVDVSDAVARAGGPFLSAVPPAASQDAVAEEARARHTSTDALPSEEAAPASPSPPGPAPGAAAPGDPARAGARVRVREAERVHAAAVTAAEAAGHRVDAARAAAAGSAALVSRLEGELAAARAEDRAHREAVTEATRARRGRNRELRRAERALAAARAELPRDPVQS